MQDNNSFISQYMNLNTQKSENDIRSLERRINSSVISYSHHTNSSKETEHNCIAEKKDEEKSSVDIIPPLISPTHTTEIDRLSSIISNNPDGKTSEGSIKKDENQLNKFFRKLLKGKRETIMDLIDKLVEFNTNWEINNSNKNSKNYLTKERIDILKKIIKETNVFEEYEPEIKDCFVKFFNYNIFREANETENDEEEFYYIKE